jgi:predicted  nucleic acid-binding Zn-ribbon protein
LLAYALNFAPSFEDISEFKSVRYSAEASLKQTNDDLALAQRDVARLKREIENLKQSDSTKTQSIKDLERKLREKESQLKSTLTSNESEILRLSSSAKTFASEKEKLLSEVEKLSMWKRNAEETIASQCGKIESINSQLQRMERDLTGAPSSEYETLLKERATLIERLAAVKQELVQKNDKIKTTKIQTENLLRKNRSYASSVPPGAVIRTVRTPILSNSIVVGEFTSRRRNIAEDSPSMMIKTVSAPSSPKQQQTSTAVEVPPQQLEKTVVSPPNAPTLLEISSNMATTLTKSTSSSSTMSAYDQALAKAKQAADTLVAASEPKAQVTTASKSEAKAPPAPMSGWAGYKDSRFGGYLDNLSSPTVESASASKEKAYKYKDNAQKGFGYLENLSQSAETPSSSQNESDRKQEYLAAEKQYLLDAKNLALTAAKSFQEAQTKPNDKDALEKANAQKREVDELLAKAKEMRAKAEAITS